jgi:hypothetical protein
MEQGFYRPFPFSQEFCDFVNLFLLKESEGNDFLVFGRELSDFLLDFQKVLMLFQFFLRLYQFAFRVIGRSQFEALLLQFFQ